MNETAVMINDMTTLDTFFTSLGVFVTGFAISFAFVGIFIYQPGEAKEYEPEYEEKYREDFEELESKDLSDDFVKSLATKYLREETPNGEVIMCYSKDTESYHYWCDDKNIKFLTLDAVSHKYALENDCKVLCVNYKEEFEKAVEKVNKYLEDKNKKNDEIEGAKQDDEDVKRNVFAKFKSYNTVNKDTSDDKNKESVQVERCNKFRYKGKLSEWVDESTKEKDKLEVKEISLTEWLRNSKPAEKEGENIVLKTEDSNELETKKEK